MVLEHSAENFAGGYVPAPWQQHGQNWSAVQWVECGAWGNTPEGASPAQTLQPAWQRPQGRVLPPDFCCPGKFAPRVLGTSRPSVTAPCASCLGQLCVARRGMRLHLTDLPTGPRDWDPGAQQQAHCSLLHPPVPGTAEAPAGRWTGRRLQASHLSRWSEPRQAPASPSAEREG